MGIHGGSGTGVGTHGVLGAGVGTRGTGGAGVGMREVLGTGVGSAAAKYLFPSLRTGSMGVSRVRS